MKIIQILLLIFYANLLSGQTLTKEIDNTYNFKPGKLSDKERESRLSPLNQLWEKVKSDTTKYLPLLRDELKTNVHNPFFYYDGSMLLLSLSEQTKDKQLAVEAIDKSDIEDVSPRNYVMTLNQLANEGYNVTKPAVKILTIEKYSFFLAEHGMKFTQEFCLTYMLVPQNSPAYVDTLLVLFPLLKPDAQMSVLTTLWLACTCKGNAFLQMATADKSFKKEVREYAKQMMAFKELRSDQKDYLKTITKEQFENLRKNALKRFSDEAIDELIMTTVANRRDGNCK